MAFLSHGRKKAVGGAVQDEQLAHVCGGAVKVDSVLPFRTMTKLTISQVSEQNADHGTQTKYQCAQSTTDMNVQEAEENARIGLLVDVGFPTRVHGKHLSGLLFFCFCSFATHDVILIPIVAEPKPRKRPHPRSVF
jgi:hypothetical protein